jgi:hypothetical protein
VGRLLEVLGLSLERKSREHFLCLPLSSLKKGYKALGYRATSSTSRDAVIDVLVKQHPSDSLIYQKLVTGWCMAPIKSKRKDVVESFRQGNMAEPMIHQNVIPFIQTNTKGLIHVIQAFQVGLVKSREDHVSAVSPDAVCVMGCTTVGLADDDDSKLANHVRKLSRYLTTRTEGVEKVCDDSSGVVFNFMATLEYKHKSEARTQQEVRKICSQILKGQKVVVLDLQVDADVCCFRLAIPSIDYRCQVVHECVICKTPVAVYAAATTQVEFVVIVIVPSLISMAYRSFTNLIREEYMDWLFKPGTNEFDETLGRMPRYTANDISWGYAKDSDTVRCRLSVMMSLYALRTEQGSPLQPSNGLIPRVVSSWNIGKGPIDDMSQVLASSLPSFGPIHGMCWIWIRTWMVMMYNAWRLNAMHASKHFVLSERCTTRKKLLAARAYHGKTFVAFLKTLYDTVEIPEILRVNDSMDDVGSPQRPHIGKGRVTYDMWAEDEAWVKFRTSPHPGHVPSNITTLVRQMFLTSSAGKRKRKDGSEQGSTDDISDHRVDDVHVEDGLQTNQSTLATPVKSKRAPDNRKWCFRCSYKVLRENKGQKNQKPQNVSRIHGLKPKKTNSICMRCQVALCEHCFRLWHDEEGLPPTPATPL